MQAGEQASGPTIIGHLGIQCSENARRASGAYGFEDDILPSPSTPNPPSSTLGSATATALPQMLVSVVEDVQSPSRQRQQHDEEEEEEEESLPALSSRILSQLAVNPTGTVKSRKGSILGVVGGVANRLDLLYTSQKKLDETAEEQMARTMAEEEALAGENMGGKIVIYTTSMRAIPKTRYACDSVRRILQLRRLQFEERDIFCDQSYAEELRARVPDSATPPQLFLNGKYVGNETVVLALSESGDMDTLFAGVPHLAPRTPADCGSCGGIGFTACQWCHGSKRSMSSQFGVLRCTACNENALTPCPKCHGGD